jgi:hypothetical protein
MVSQVTKFICKQVYNHKVYIHKYQSFYVPKLCNSFTSDVPIYN